MAWQMPIERITARRVKRKKFPVRPPMRSISLDEVGLGFGGVCTRSVRSDMRRTERARERAAGSGDLSTSRSDIVLKKSED